MGSTRLLASGHGLLRHPIGGGLGRETKAGFSTRAETLTTLSFVSPSPLQESLRLQEQAALETEDGEGLQQTLRDLAQV